MEIFLQIIGWVGMGLVLLAYYLNETDKISSRSVTYHLLNLFGAIGVGFNVFHQQAWSAFALQIAWGIIAILSLRRKKK